MKKAMLGCALLFMAIAHIKTAEIQEQNFDPEKYMVQYKIPGIRNYYLNRALLKKMGVKASAQAGAKEFLAGLNLSKPSLHANMTMKELGVLPIQLWMMASGAYYGILSDLITPIRINSSPEFATAFKNLMEQDILEEDIVLPAGIPTDKQDQLRKDTLFNRFTLEFRYAPKNYLLPRGLANINYAFDNNHYELYFMPKDVYLFDLFKTLYETFQHSFRWYGAVKEENRILFLALRPNPGITKSRYNSKIMPRIIVGFKPTATKESVEKQIALLITILKEKYPDKAFAELGMNVQPRYSHKINELMYTAYGSADYKDSAEGQKKFANKMHTWYQRWVSGPSDEDMAYQNDSERLSLMPKPKRKRID